MAGAFQGGFRMGQQAWQQALDNQDREERRKREADEYGLRRQQLVLQNQAAEDAAAQRRELAGIRTQIGDFQQGFNRAGYNAAADADFDSALAASDAAVKAENAARRGLAPTPAPAYVPPTQGNLANDEATRARFTQAPDITNDDYMRNMSGLRQRYALAAGDMKGFDDMAAAERNRRTAIDDSAFARAVTTNPEGPEAKAARAYVNRNSRKLTTRVDPKTNMTTFVLAQDDGYNEVKVNPSDLARIAVGVRRLERGDVGGLDIISAVNKDLAAAVREDMKLDMDAGKGNNDAAYKIGSLNNQTEGLRLQGEGLRLKQKALGIDSQRLQLARMGAAQYREGEDGNLYALVPTMTQQGVKFETVRVNPDNVKLKKEGGAPGKDVELKPGTIYQTPEGVRYKIADNGEKLVDGAPEPGQRTTTLIKLGFAKQDAEAMQWAPGGREISWGGMAFDVNNPKDMAALKEEIRQHKIASQAAQEYERSGGRTAWETRSRPASVPLVTGLGLGVPAR